VSVLVSGSRNLHDIQAKPSMVLSVRDADMIIRLGMSQDKWIDGLIEVSRNPKLFPNKPGYVDPSLVINALEVPTGQIDGRHGDIHIEGNPHYWLDPQNGLKIAALIRDRLSQLDPSSADLFNTNYQQFEKDLMSKFSIWSSKLSSLKPDLILSYHLVWSYFLDAFELDFLATLEPVPGVPPSARHLNDLNTQIGDSKAKIICAVYYPQKVCRESANLFKASFSPLITNSETADKEAYFKLFDRLTTDINK
jgi:ABC-type metal ion transport system, periplasmic component/surface adhesin